MAGSLPKIVGGILEQVVAYPALVGYQKSGRDEYLGCFFDMDDDLRAELTLSICRDVETKAEYLIYLHVPFTRPKWKSPREIYLVIPVKKLQLEPDILQAGEIPQAVSEGLKKNNQVLRVVVRMGRPAYAVMPCLSQVSEVPLEGVQSQLLRHWKNLVHQNKIDIYLSDPSVFDTFRDLDMEIRNGQSATSELDLNRLYQGCRGMINNWEQYPCKRNQSQPSPHFGGEPPFYNDVQQPAPPKYTRQSESNILRFGLNGLHSSGPEIYWSNTPRSSQDTRVFKDADHIRKRKATEELERDSNPSAKARAIARITPGTPTQADSIHLASPPHSGNSSPATEPHRDSDTLLHWDAEIEEFKETIRLSVQRRGKSVKSSDQHQIALLEAPLFDVELQELILTMWDYNLNAHDSFRDQLLGLGLIARRNSSINDFDTAKANLYTAFLERTSKMIVMRRYRPTNLQEDTLRFRDWLNHRISRRAETMLTDSLRELHWCWRKLGLAPATESEVKEFLEKKARCCALGFIMFGRKVDG